MTTIQRVLDVSVDCAIERGDFMKALRMRWMSHANNTATIEPVEVLDFIMAVRGAPEKDFQMVGK